MADLQKRNSRLKHLKEIYFRLYMPSSIVQLTDTTDYDSISGKTSVRKYTIISKECSFTIGKTLRRDTFGIVKLARAAIGNTRLAVKIIHKGRAELEEYSQVVLFREIALMKMLSGHPNFVKLVSVVHNDNFTILAMEYTEGQTLLEYIKSKKHLDEMEAKRIFKDLVNGVAVCHSMGISIRSLSCKNLLLDNKQNVKISNFEHGFVQGFDTFDLFRGTPNSAPEVSIIEEYDYKAVDIWSLGVILYTMVMSPTREEQDWSKSPLLFPDKGSLSVECMNLIHRMMSISPEERPTILEVKEDQWVDNLRNVYFVNHQKESIIENESKSIALLTSTTKTVDSADSIGKYSE